MLNRKIDPACVSFLSRDRKVSGRFRISAVLFFILKGTFDGFIVFKRTDQQFVYFYDSQY